MSKPELTPDPVDPDVSGWDSIVTDNFETLRAWLSDGPLPIYEVADLGDIYDDTVWDRCLFMVMISTGEWRPYYFNAESDPRRIALYEEVVDLISEADGLLLSLEITLTLGDTSSPSLVEIQPKYADGSNYTGPYWLRFRLVNWGGDAGRIDLATGSPNQYVNAVGTGVQTENKHTEDDQAIVEVYVYHATGKCSVNVYSDDTSPLMLRVQPAQIGNPLPANYVEAFVAITHAAP